MKALLKFRKLLAWTFIFIVLNSSCIIYKKKPITTHELKDVKSEKVKLITTSGDVYKTYWTNVKDDEVEIYEKAKTSKIRQNSIKHVSYYGPQYKIVDLESALEYEGTVMVETDKRQYQFSDIKKEGKNIIGYILKGDNSEKIIIPLEELDTIKVQNKRASRVGNVFLGIGIGYVVLMGIAIAAIANNPPTIHLGI